ncbi:sodium:proton antiporter [Thiocapsa imhoffii]|uniref:Sodium:proton antiporter n=1 Tax=Thiocapsa imhoffii TaxID=382777 RepID=A0A9X0WKC5_9GAMM|nr:sodium:proton antiporter [Thiocapsa imhoffii]MBK1646304.1 sodium:proton antiporter [Thiocapsa imhoffii]
MLDALDTPGVHHALYAVGSMALFSIGLYGLLTRRHLLKIFMSLAIMEMAVYLLFIGLTTQPGRTAPILSDGLVEFAGTADPVPQALTLTALVIALAVLALGVSMSIRYHQLTGTTDVETMSALKDP